MTTITAQRRTAFENYKMGLHSSRTFEPRSPLMNSFSNSYGTVRPTSVGKRISKLSISPKQIFIAVLVSISILAIMLPATTAFGRRPLVSSDRPSSENKNSVVSVVVEPGDTLWSIAGRLEPNSDLRQVVDDLVKARGTADVYVGETIEWTK